MTTYLHDGTVFDLTIPYRDVTGVEWKWSGKSTQAGEPLMRECPGKTGEQTVVSLPDLYKYHGPLIPVHDRPSRAQYRAAVDPNYAATVAAGYVEDHIAAAVAPVLTANHLQPSPLEQTGFRRFLDTISGRAPAA